MMTILAAALALSDVSIVTADGKQISAREITIADDAGQLTLEYTDASNRRQTLRCSDVVEITLGTVSPRKKFAPEDVLLTTTTGDVFHAAIVGPGKEKYSVRFSTGPFGEIDFLFEQLFEMRLLSNQSYWPKREIEFSRRSDLLVTKTSDRAEGTINSIDRSAVDFKSARTRQNQKMPLDQLALVLFMKPSRSVPKPPSTLYSILTGTDGSTLQGVIQELKGGVLVFRDLRGAVHRISAASVAGLHFRNGRVVYVSDLAPSKVEENANYIRPPDGSSLPSDLSYPWKADRNAEGNRLAIRGREFRKGIGVRAYSSLTYPLGGSFKKFQASVGVDDCGPQGDVVFEIWIDGKKAVSQPAKAGEAAIDLEVDVSGAKELRLVVDFGGNANIGDFADWGSARLLKE